MDAWKNIVVHDVAFALYVPAGTGALLHITRPYHGLVLNCPGSEKEYCFSDGTVLRTHGGDLFYLPEGSTYQVKSIVPGGCYAINFYANVQDRPFVQSFRNSEPLFKLFREAEVAWRVQSDYSRITAIRTVYDLILQLCKEKQRAYVPNSQAALIEGAVETMRRDFTRNDLTIAALAASCGISEAYFRKIFLNEFGISPKDYLIHLRIQYAKQLLSSGDFTIAQAAQICGYKEPCHFSREFTKHVGMPPSKYKTP